MAPLHRVYNLQKHKYEGKKLKIWPVGLWYSPSITLCQSVRHWENEAALPSNSDTIFHMVVSD